MFWPQYKSSWIAYLLNGHRIFNRGMNVRWINACKIHRLKIVAAERKIGDHAPEKPLASSRAR
jgi:hypothetical protein